MAAALRKATNLYPVGWKDHYRAVGSCKFVLGVASRFGTHLELESEFSTRLIVVALVTFFSFRNAALDL